jgi:adenylate cyclase
MSAGLESRNHPARTRYDEIIPPRDPSHSVSPSRTVEATFCFVDLAGFTALTEEHGDEDAADLAMRFAALARSCLDAGDLLVKTIGDAVLLRSQSAAAGVALIERLFTLAAEDPRFPSLRAGLHEGSAVEVEGDVFGAAVNLAARVTSEAHAGEVLCTATVADAARARGVPVAELGPVLMKNVSREVALFSLGLVLGSGEVPEDPVCHVPIDRRAAIGRLRYKNKEYWFCSLTCAATFASNPAWHAMSSAKVKVEG